MKTIIAAAAALFAANVGATDIYYTLGEGNPDLSTDQASVAEFVGVQPSIGDAVDRYHGLADGNPDLFKADRSGPTDTSSRPDIYKGFASGNPDLQF